MVEFSHSTPDELQFSCARHTDGRESDLAEALAAGQPARRVEAARRLWRGHSRSHARAVLAFVSADPPAGAAGFAALKREVDDALKPGAVLREMRDGDYRWGAWLAGLRPHKDFVPELLTALKTKPDFLPETTFALGASGDRAALKPLVELLKAGDYRASGDAARALGYLGLPEAEPDLIAALDGKGWAQLQASVALGKVGTRRAVPALTKLAESDAYTGALNVKGMAQQAVKSIEKRERKMK